MTQRIDTPKGSVIQGPNGRAELVWNPGFSGKWELSYSRAQEFVDSQVLAYSEPFIPLETGMLIQSGILGTDVGSGLVSWIAPYARYQFYLKRKTQSTTGPLRGSYWFQRMKDIYKDTLVAGARAIAGRSK